LASATLKRFEDEGRQQDDLPMVHYALQHCLHQCGVAFDEVLSNFPRKGVGRLLRTLLFPLGIRYQAPKDEITVKIAELLMTPGAHRERLTHMCYVGEKDSDPVAIMERAFIAMHGVKDIERKLAKATKSGEIPRKVSLTEKLQIALSAGIVTDQDVEKMHNADQLRQKAIQVDHFAAAQFKKGSLQPGKAA
jgi:hypothetical protein